MKNPLANLADRLPLSTGQWLIVGCLLLLAVSSAVYSQWTLTGLRQGLPASVLQQSRELNTIQHGVHELMHAVDLAGTDWADPQSRADVLEQNAQVAASLMQLRQSFVFDNQVGAADIYALALPVTQDLHRWLSDGLPGVPAGDLRVQRLAMIRVREAYQRIAEQIAAGNAQALHDLQAEADQVQRFRNAAVGVQLVLLLITAFAIAQFIGLQRKAQSLAAVQQRLRDAIESIPEGIALWDRNERLVLWNSRMGTLYPEIRQKLHVGAYYPDLVEAFFHRVRPQEGDETPTSAIAERRDPDEPLEHVLPDGRYIRVREQRMADGSVVGVHADISDLRQVQQRLEHLATHDTLTGLPNRALVQRRLNQSQARARRHGGGFAVLYIDLDRFKVVNDTLGHHAGDNLLKQVAQRLNAVLRTEDILARLGGDEFLIILEGVADERGAVGFAQRLQTAMNEPFYVEAQAVSVACSIGIALYPAHGEDIDAVLRHADAASYEAKRIGPNLYRVYSPEITRRSRMQWAMESALLQALERDQLEVWYQPMVDLVSGRVLALEALVRWLHPEQGVIAPAEFLHLAEDNGLIVRIDDWVLNTACARFAAWDAMGLAPARLAVNLSGLSLARDGLVTRVLAVLAEYGLATGRLEVEFAESQLRHRDRPLQRVVRELANQGVGVALDDFGTGRASLSVLRRLPLNHVKIDLELIARLTDRSQDQSVINAVLAMGKTLAFTLVAEGVETEMQRSWLIEQGCREGQGRLFCPPLTAARMERVLDERRTRETVLPTK